VFLPRNALLHSAVLRLHVICLSVCLSVCPSVYSLGLLSTRSDGTVPVATITGQPCSDVTRS